MKNKEEIMQRLDYNKSMENVAKKMVEDLLKDKDLEMLIKGENSSKLLKWLTANVAWSMSMARQDELKWVMR